MESKIKTFLVTEAKGSLPYMLAYWSKTGCPVTVIKRTYEEALEAHRNLKNAGIESSIFLSLTNGAAVCQEHDLEEKLKTFFSRIIDGNTKVFVQSQTAFSASSGEVL